MRAFLSRLLVLAATLPAVVAVVTTGAALPARAAQWVDGVRLNPFEARLLSDMNRARANAGLAGLTVTTGTTDVARRWTWKIAAAQSLSHNPGIAAALSAAASPSWTMIEENVGFGPALDPDTLFYAYMGSPEHRANILSPAVRYVGVGAVERDGAAGAQTVWNTVDFVDQYSFGTYGPTRVPAPGVRYGDGVVTATRDLATFDTGVDTRFCSSSSGALRVSRPWFDPAGSTDGALHASVSAVSTSGGNAWVDMHDSVDLRDVVQVAVHASVADPEHRALQVNVYADLPWVNDAYLGTVTIQPSATWVSVPIPSAVRAFRPLLVLQVTATQLSRLGSSLSQRRAQLNVYDVRAVT